MISRLPVGTRLRQKSTGNTGTIVKVRDYGGISNASYYPVRWDNSNFVGSVAVESDKWEVIPVPTLADLIAEKDRIIKECEASITAAKAVIAELTKPKVGGVYKQGPFTAVVLEIHENIVFYRFQQMNGPWRGAGKPLSEFSVFYRVGEP